jgi:zinc transport system permease protein
MLTIILTTLFSGINLGILGSFVIWNRIVNIGDSLAHALIITVIIESIFGINQSFASIILAILFVSFIHLLANKKDSQNLNMIILSTSLVAISILLSNSLDISHKMNSFIIGDALNSSSIDMIVSFSTLVLLSIFVYRSLNKLVLISLSEEIAYVRGINVRVYTQILNIILGITIAISIKIIGTILMVSLLIIPPAIANIYAKSPKSMISLSALFSSICCLISVAISYKADVPLSALYVTVLFTLYISSIILKNFILDKS